MPGITAGEALHPCTSSPDNVIVPESVITVILRKGEAEGSASDFSDLFEEKQHTANREELKRFQISLPGESERLPEAIPDSLGAESSAKSHTHLFK